MEQRALDAVPGALPGASRSPLDRLLETAPGAPAMGVSAAWVSAAAISRQAISLLALAVLARLVTPSDYGLYAVAFAVGALAVIFAESGIGAAVITHRDLRASTASTAFYMNAGAAVTAGLGLAAAAAPLGWVFGEAELVPLLLMMALATALTLSVAHLALLERLKGYRQIALIELAATVAGQGAAVAAGLAGLGAPSLTVAPVVTAASLTVLAVVTTRWVPRPTITRADARTIWRFSRPLLTFNAVHYWARNADKLLLGRFAGARELGLYSSAYTLMMVPIQQVASVLAKVLLPYLTRHRDDGAGLWASWVLAARTALILGLPVSALLTAFSEDLIRLFLGSQWVAAAPILAVLGLSIPAQLLLRISGAAYQAAHMPSRQLRVGLINTGMIGVGICAGLPWGAMGVAIGVCLSYSASIAVVLADLMRRLGGSVRSLVVTLPPVLAATGMALCMLGVRTLEPSRLGTGAAGIAGAAVYIGVLAAAWPREAAQYVRQARRVVHRARSVRGN